MTFIAVDGCGIPNTSEEYRLVLEALYGLSYTIKMSKMSAMQPQGYFEYVEFPLEGLWWFEEDLSHLFNGLSVADKTAFFWRSMIRQPDFVNESVLELAKASQFQFHEGLCVQCMHIGPFDAEPATIKAMTQLALDQGYGAAIMRFT
jgi:hypothetical protein